MSDPASTQPADALILFGHGARDPQWAQPMQRVATLLAAQAPALAVRLAFLEFMTPTLPEAIDELAVAHREIVVVPMFMAQAGHLKRDLPQLIEAACARHPALGIRLAGPVGEAEAVLRAIAGHALALAAGGP